MNSNQFFTLLQKGNDLQKEDFQQLVKLHASFPYFQIPAVLAAKYEHINSKDGSTDLLHKAAILSPDRAWLRSLIELNIPFIGDDLYKDLDERKSESPSVVIIDNQTNAETADTQILEDTSISSNDDKSLETNNQEDIKQPDAATEDIKNSTKADKENNFPSPSLITDSDSIDSDSPELSQQIAGDNKKLSENPNLETSSTKTNLPIDEEKEDFKSEIITSSHPKEESVHPLITSPSGGDEDTRPDLIIPDSMHQGSDINEDQSELIKPEINENDKPIIEPISAPQSSRQQILKQLEDNLARLKSESTKNKPDDEDLDEEPKSTKPRRKRAGEDLIDSIKKKEKREIKDTKKKEQNDIIKAFNKKSIKLAAIKENEDVNKLQDLSLPSTKINDRMVSESYAKLLTQQGKKVAAKEIYKKLILKFPQKKAYFADLIQQLEE